MEQIKNILRRIPFVLTIWRVYQTVKFVRQGNLLKLYDFPSVSAWLNKLTDSQKYFSLVFKLGETWIVLKNGLQFKYTNKFNSVSAIIVSHGSFEEVELDVVSANLSDNSVFFDIGANVGFYSLSIAHEIKGVEIHAFEPLPDTVLDFKDNMSRNELDHKIILNQIAVGNTDELVYITSDYHSSNYITDSKSTQNKIEVECTKVDSYVRDNSIQRIDFIKIDVEGKEFSVLRGGEESLKRFRPIVLVEILEVPSNFFDRKTEGFRETINFMLNLGYKYYVIDDNNNLVYMDRIKEAIFSRSYHNYLFYYNKVNVSMCRNQAVAL